MVLLPLNNIWNLTCSSLLKDFGTDWNKLLSCLRRDAEILSWFRAHLTVALYSEEIVTFIKYLLISLLSICTWACSYEFFSRHYLVFNFLLEYCSFLACCFKSIWDKEWSSLWEIFWSRRKQKLIRLTLFQGCFLKQLSFWRNWFYYRFGYHLYSFTDQLIVQIIFYRRRIWNILSL